MPLPVVRFERVGHEPDLSRLTEWELARHDRIRVPSARRAYVAAHLLVRDVLHAAAGPGLEIGQRCTGCGETGHGAPYVVGHPELFVSLSHSHRGGEAWVAAVAAEAPCGIDVQVVGRVPDRALTAREREAVGGSDHLRSQLWARKEAWIKAGAATLDDLGQLEVGELLPGMEDWKSSAPTVVGAWVVST